MWGKVNKYTSKLYRESKKGIVISRLSWLPPWIAGIGRRCLFLVFFVFFVIFAWLLPFESSAIQFIDDAHHLIGDFDSILIPPYGQTRHHRRRRCERATGYLLHRHP